MSGALHFARGIVVIGSMLVTTGGATPARTPGDPIPDIDVTVEQHPGSRLNTHTDANGAFSFTLPAGTYTLRVGSKPTPSGAATKPSASRPGVSNGRIVPLPDVIPVGGAFPYVLRLVETNVAITRWGYAGQGVPAQNQRAAAPPDFEVTLTLGPAAARAGAMFTLRGSVESAK